MVFPSKIPFSKLTDISLESYKPSNEIIDEKYFAMRNKNNISYNSYLACPPLISKLVSLPVSHHSFEP